MAGMWLAMDGSMHRAVRCAMSTARPQAMEHPPTAPKDRSFVIDKVSLHWAALLCFVRSEWTDR